MDYGLGRIYSPDDRDKNFPMAAIMADVSPPNSKYWRLGPQLDQGQTPRCVGYSTRQLLTSSPHRFKKADPTADEIYFNAQKLDEWPGENYPGTSARGAMKYLAGLGIIAAYHWAQDVEEVCRYVLTTGPALIGANWHEEMFNPDPKGFVKPTGAIAGGHEFLLVGYNHTRRTLTFDNSWGSSWGLKGRFRMNRTDFESLMADQGDMVAPLEA